MRQPEYTRTTRFSVTPKSMKSLALGSQYYQHHRLVNYPRHAHYPDSVEELKQARTWDARLPSNTYVDTLEGTLVYKLTEAMLVAEGNREDIMEFRTFQYGNSHSLVISHQSEYHPQVGSQSNTVVLLLLMLTGKVLCMRMSTLSVSAIYAIYLYFH